ncbi:MAG: hypothetical protein OJF52_004654 [Nitrospira sp.]|nr:MAG: hypothetical protein OJF52_004654 [Nitrospira sp.]
MPPVPALFTSLPDRQPKELHFMPAPWRNLTSVVLCLVIRRPGNDIDA